MADTKISAAADIVTLVATDMAPVARSGSTTAYHATMAEIATWANTNLPTASTTVLGGVKVDGTTITIASGVISGAAPPSPSSSVPAMDGTGAPGTVPAYSRGDHIHPTDTTRAPLASPALTGSPTAPTVTPATDNTTKLATTAFVQSAMSAAGAGVSSWNTRTGAVTLNNADVVAVLAPSSTTPSMDGTAAVGTGTTWARADHVHPTDTSRAPVASPTFTGTVTIPAGATITGYAPLASPTFTGTPSLPTGTTGITQTAGNNTTALATTQFVQAAAAPAFNDTGRNLLHNGQFNVNQRAWTAGALPVSTLGYGFDRWIFQTQGSDTGTTAIITMADSDRSAIGDEAAEVGFSWAMAGASAANSSSNFQQRIEDVRRLGGKIVTTSFWARALSGTPSVGLSMVQIFGSGGSPSPTVITGIGRVTLTATWARYTLTGTVPSTSGKTLGSTANTSFTTATFVLSDVSNVYGTGIGQQASGTAAFYGVQLELGSVATPLAYRDPQQELALCQRFYQSSGTPLLVYGYNGAGGFVISTFTYPVTMRANPTVAFSSVSYTNASAIQANGSSNNYGLSVQITASAAGTAYANYSVTASADL